MTAEGLAKLEEELKQLKAEERPAVIRAIAEARANGDLSENAEYHAARERQAFVDGRTAEPGGVVRPAGGGAATGARGENAESRAARERQSFVEGRIAELETVVPLVEVIDVAKLSGDQVKFGARVTIIDEESEEEKTYRIVGAHEADMKVGTISLSSPLAKALIGKKIGDSVEVPAPGGARGYESTDGQA